MTKWLAVCAVLLVFIACEKAPRLPRVPELSLVTSDGVAWSWNRDISSSRFTIIEFFSADCPVQKSHDHRLIQLYERYRSQGVKIVVVDSESAASPGRDAAEAHRRRFPFPILIDKGGRFADMLGAEYATYTVIVDGEGRSHYEGGIDSDHSTLNKDSIPYLRNALDDLLAGTEPQHAKAKTFGCTLQKW
jgi:thiol-disulfide isomerase/thioredoxin